MWPIENKVKYYKIYNRKYYKDNKIRLKFKKQLKLNKNLKEDVEFLKFLDYYFFDESLSESSVFDPSSSESGI